MAGARWIRALSVTIRGKIVLAFGALVAITALLGVFGISSVIESGRLVVDTYDRPLMSISYARLALADFTQLQLALAQRSQTNDAAQLRASDRHIDDLTQSLRAALIVAQNRASSPRAVAAAGDVARAIAEWEMAHWRMESEPADEGLRHALDERATTVIDSFDNLVELTAEDGFRDRERALTSIEIYRRLSIAATILALLLGTGVAMSLARRMVRPIAAASNAAKRIAAGELDIEIVSAGHDELGQLLGSMAVMRDNIRRMMEGEIAARRSAQARLVNAIESSDEGVILVDGEGRILICNSQIGSFFPEFAASFLPGAQLPDLIETALAEASRELSLGDGRWLRLSRSHSIDGGYVIIVSDITMLKERETALHAAKDQAETANRSKSEFLANMSHELRTPLNAIIGFSEVIRDAMMGPLDIRYKDYANDIHTSGRHLLNLINDVLDLSKIEAGRLELYEETVDLGKLVVSCNRVIRERASEAKLELALHLPSDALLIRGDERRLKQVVLNLLSNAVKFTPPEGRIAVSAAFLPTSETVISVADTGIGMTAQEVEIAMEPFRQIDGALNRKYQGTGLGLPLVQRLVRLHGGTMEVKSQPGAGTTVTITLPADRRIRDVA